MGRVELKSLFVCALVLLISTSPFALADWDEGDGHKMHFPQLPDPTGFDVSWQYLWALGDDWRCSEAGPVEDIHFWVSFEYGMGGPYDIQNFNIEIWSNNPGTAEMPWSHPDQMLWRYPHPTFTWRPVDTDWQGWFDPANFYWLNNNHMGCWQINIENIPEPFIQEEGEIYWLVINDVFTTDGVHMGWKESGSVQFMDDAVWWDGFYPPFWNELYDPEMIPQESMDLAFVITGREEEPELEYGDAPEDGEAYPSLCVTGWFPTCINVGPIGSYIQHNNFGAHFGPGFDFEPDGNAGVCQQHPNCFPPYDQDECFQDGDAGLLNPVSYTIQGGAVALCPGAGGGANPSLGTVCTNAVWGKDVDIEVHNHMPNQTVGYVNVLMDFNRNGVWDKNQQPCPDGTTADEWVLQNWPIRNPYDGPLSGLMPAGTSFLLGPYPGHVWTRFTITEEEIKLPVGVQWDGSGIFEDGESEDYLLLIDPIDKPYDCNWEPGDDHKMHRPQLPDLEPTGVDVDMLFTALGDDFECSQTGKITDIHIWSSFPGDCLPLAGVEGLHFQLAIHADIPDPDPTDPDTWSMPGKELWSRDFVPCEYTVSQVADSNIEDWYDPVTGTYNQGDHKECYQYNFCIDEDEAWRQIEGTIYWLVVTYFYHDGDSNFGWKTTRVEPKDLRWNDDGVWWNDNPDLPPPLRIGWNPLKYPDKHEYAGETMDLAFVITGVQELDFGDAQDNPPPISRYPTLLVNNGARHIIAGPWMGDITDIPDGELDGQPTPAATGDDGDGNDDEDGLILPTLTTGQAVNFNLEVRGAGGVVEIWIDYNINGNWDDAGELAYSGFLPVGVNPIAINVPAAALPGMTFARARISSAGTGSPRGLADDGEVEDTEVEIKEPPPELDFGDAPDPTYPTLAANNGANHIIVAGVFLGLQIDAEPDGQPTLAADGDDKDILYPPANDDEDGVTFLSPIIPWTTVNVNVVASANGSLSAWFDFNADGDWDDAGENIFAGQPLIGGAGGNALQFNVPMTAPVGKTTYSRWRFVRTAAAPSYRGQALDGEVEDYKHEIEERPPKARFVKHSKWSQPPIELDPSMEVPVFCGWDEMSLREWIEPLWFDCWDCLTQCHGDADCDGYVGPLDLIILQNAMGGIYPNPPYDACADFDRNLVIGASDLNILLLNWDTYPPPDCRQRPQYWQVAADDFRCLGDMPITSIHWWGSHYGWEGPEPGTTPPEPNRPIAWRIGFWSNVPAVGTGTDECTWNPGDPNKMHYPQEPKPGGWNVAFSNSRLADDWKCSEYGPVSDIHFWVSWKGDNVQTIPGFSVRIHSDIPDPDGDGPLYSMPAGDFKWERDFYPGDFTVRDMPPDLQGWFDPYSGEINRDDHTAWQQIDICKILDPFHQEEGTIYWLEIDFGSLPDIGWKESGSDHFNDDAVRWEFPDWMELRDPFTEESLDLAFVITTEKYSHPEKLLWVREFDADRVKREEVGTDYFHPDETGLPNDICYQYNLELEVEEYFWQGKYLERTEDSVFWLSIAAVYPEEGVDLKYPWGWKTRPWHWMDDAVRIWHEGPLEPGTVLDPYSMEPIKDPRDPEFGKSFDLAFELDTDPNWIKWEQHFTGIRDWPHYEDVNSFATVETITENITKWSQEPDRTEWGMDVDATMDLTHQAIWPPQILADDFNCVETGPVTDIHIWGSWLDDKIPFGDPMAVEFTLSIYSNNPMGPMGWSEPLDQLWTMEFPAGAFTVDWAWDGWEGYFNPCEFWYHPFDNHFWAWKYNFYIDEAAAFIQEGDPCEPVIYWLAVQARPMPDPHFLVQARFGWKTSITQWNDDAVFTIGEWGQPFEPWRELRHPETGESLDLAFEITSEKEEEVFTIHNRVADDWDCRQRWPVTALSWWGSYKDFQYWACHGEPQMEPPEKPDYFLLSIWTDVRPTPDEPYSHPGKQIWEYKVKKGEYNEVLVGYDKHPHDAAGGATGPPREAVFRYSAQIPDPNDWFLQEDVNGIYWLSVLAVYEKPLADIRHPWGWTNHKCTAWEPEGLTELAHWKLNELGGDIAHDSSGNGNDGKLVNGPTWASGKICGGALDFDDGNDYVDCGNDPIFDLTDEITLSAWINIRSVPWKWSTIVSKGDSAWRLSTDKLSTGMHFAVRGGAVPAFGVNSLNAVPIGEWHHVCGTFDGSNIRIYIDGVEDNNNFYSNTTITTNNLNVFIGGNSEDEPNEYRSWDGLIDDVRIYDKGLSASQVKALTEMGMNDDAVEGYEIDEDVWHWNPLKDQTGRTEDMSFILYTKPCFPPSYTTYPDWVAMGKPNCWCGIYGNPQWPYQCDGDGDNKTSGFKKYRVYLPDLTLVVNNWEKKIDDPTLDPCADIDHKPSGFKKYRVYLPDLTTVVNNWEKKDYDPLNPMDPNNLPGDCPRPE